MRLLFLNIVFLFASFEAFTQSIEEENLIVTVKEFHQALVNKNIIAINQQTDKGLTYGHSNGWVQTKEAIIKDFETNYISYQSFKEDSISVSLGADLASVRFVADITATLKGNMANHHIKVLEVWVKKSKRWVLFARQAIKS